MRLRSPLSLLLVSLAIPSGAQQVMERSWIDSAEAYFATAAERREWGTLKTNPKRDAFRDRYWLRRDPTPGTPQNEFRDVITARIKKANEKFSIEKTPGSETARGFVYVVFGPPARFRTSSAPPPAAPRPPGPGQTYTPQATTEIGEAYETWIYDRERTPHLLQMVGLPTLTFDFVIRPQRHIDELQSPGLAAELREKLAQRSIANPDAGLGSASASSSILAARLDAQLPDSARAALDEAPPPSFASPSGFFGQSVLWSAQGAPLVTVWLAAPPEARVPPAGSRFIGRISRPDGSLAGMFSEPLRSSIAFASSAGGPVYAVQFTLPPGEYTSAFAVVDLSGDTIANATLPLHATDAKKPLASSSILLSATPRPAAGGMFDLGSLGVVPRADQTFSRSESLWYIGGLANPADPKSVVIDVHLRSGTKMIGAGQIALEPEPVGPNRYLFAREMPLASLEPGDYTLYVSMHDASGATEVRRADFRVTP